MKSKITPVLALAAMIMICLSCDRPVCKNMNPVFNRYAPQSNEYKAELVKQLGQTDKTTLTYWFKEYNASNGEELLLFDIQGNGLCAVIVFNLEPGQKFDLIRKKKGVSYRGAEFTNLAFDILRNGSDIKFMLKGYDKIID